MAISSSPLTAIRALARDIRFAVRALRRARGLSGTIVVTLALGIGANAAVFSVVRSVLLRPLVNREGDRLIYIRQSAPGLDVGNLTFSMPEIADFQARSTTVAQFGEFSTLDFSLVGLTPEPRMVRAGVVNGSFFDVMGLRPVLGRLLTPQDDGPNAAGAAVLTYRFWTTTLRGDPSVLGKTIRLGVRTATIVGVLEPSVPYPTDIELIANVVTSPHHLSATMVRSRTHRMTELFGRLAPGATLDAARAELTAMHASMMQQDPDAYPARSAIRISVANLRDQITAPVRTVLLILLASAAIVFLIACSNVANLVLARSVRREGELAIRAALGAGAGALRRTLLAESLVLCGAGAGLGVLLAQPLADLIASYAARFSVRALDIPVDSSVVWVGAGLALAAAMLLAFAPRLPSSHASSGFGLGSGSVRITPATNRRLRVFATTQIAFSFVLLAGAGMALNTLISLQRSRTAYDTRHVLVFDVPLPALGVGVNDPKVLDFYDEATRRIRDLPGVEAAAVGSFVPWRDAGRAYDPDSTFSVEGFTPPNGDQRPRARLRMVGPQFFRAVGLQLLAGREFTDADRSGSEGVVIVSESVARLFAGGAALNRHLLFTGGMPHRIVGVVPDVNDETVGGPQGLMLYMPVRQFGLAGRLFVHAAGSPLALVPVITRTIRQIAGDQPVERAATLEEVRADVLSPDRLNAFVFSGFAGIALLIAVVGVAGVLAFTVSVRTREFGVRLAVGSSPRQLVERVVAEGAIIATTGTVAGAVTGYLLSHAAAGFFHGVQLPGVLPVAGAALVLIAAASAAAFIPAARAARIDVLQALQSD